MLIQDQFGIIQNCLMSPIPQTSFLVRTFFSVSNSKLALLTKSHYHAFLLEIIYNLLLTFQSIFLDRSFSFLYYFHFLLFLYCFFSPCFFFSIMMPFRGDYVALRRNPLWKDTLKRNRLHRMDKSVIYADIINKINRTNGKVQEIVIWSELFIHLVQGGSYCYPTYFYCGNCYLFVV